MFKSNISLLCVFVKDKGDYKLLINLNLKLLRLLGEMVNITHITLYRSFNLLKEDILNFDFNSLSFPYIPLLKVNVDKNKIFILSLLYIEIPRF